jgi:hypothetical protein
MIVALYYGMSNTNQKTEINMSRNKGHVIAECGATRYSISNAKVLVAKHGVPMEVKIYGDPDEAEYAVDAIFRDGTDHRFTGFSLGYGGEGPRGLHWFLTELCGMSLPFEAVSNPPKACGVFDLLATPSRNRLVSVIGGV